MWRFCGSIHFDTKVSSHLGYVNLVNLNIWDHLKCKRSYILFTLILLWCFCDGQSKIWAFLILELLSYILHCWTFLYRAMTDMCAQKLFQLFIPVLLCWGWWVVYVRYTLSTKSWLWPVLSMFKSACSIMNFERSKIFMVRQKCLHWWCQCLNHGWIISPLS